MEKLVDNEKKGHAEKAIEAIKHFNKSMTKAIKERVHGKSEA